VQPSWHWIHHLDFLLLIQVHFAVAEDSSGPDFIEDVLILVLLFLHSPVALREEAGVILLGHLKVVVGPVIAYPFNFVLASTSGLPCQAVNKLAESQVELVVFFGEHLGRLLVARLDPFWVLLLQILKVGNALAFVARGNFFHRHPCILLLGVIDLFLENLYRSLLVAREGARKAALFDHELQLLALRSIFGKTLALCIVVLEGECNGTFISERLADLLASLRRVDFGLVLVHFVAIVPNIL